MKKNIGLLISILSVFVVNGQIITPNDRDVSKKTAIDDCIYRITYEYRYILNVESQQMYNDLQHLEVGLKYAHYYSKYGDLCDSITYRARLNPSSPGSSPIPRTSMGEFRLPEDEDIFYNYPQFGLIQVWTPIINTEYIYEESMPKFSWMLLPGSKEILGYNCMKASATFRGRDYIAWFSPMVPITYGPWKFNGLPGLIMEIYDTENTFIWTVVGITQPVDEKIYIIDPNNKKTTPNAPKTILVKTSRDKVLEFKRMLWAEPITLLEMHGNKVVSITGASGQSIRPENIVYPERYQKELE